MRKRFLAALAALLVSAVALGQGRVDGDVSIRFRDKTLQATLSYDYVALDDLSAIELLLNSSFDVNAVTCPICGEHRFDRSADGPGTLHIDLTRKIAAGTHVLMTISYRGSIAESYKADDEFLELGLDDFWYPVHPRIGEFEFRYRLFVRADEPRFQIVTNGTSTRKRGRWLIASRVPDIDIDIVMGRHLDRVRDTSAGYDIALITQNVPNDVPKQLAGDIRRVLDFYNSAFGEHSPERAVTGVFRPFVSRDGQGGYFRKGYFILPKLTDASAALPNIAHELAHHWWIYASQQQAWLNESFAEYSAMLAMRSLRGRAAFDAIVEEKKKRLAAAPLPPVYGFDRTKNRRVSPGVMYIKGPLVLHALEDDIGETKFLDVLRRTAEQRVVDTDRFVALVGEVASPGAAEELLRRLKE